MDKKHSKESPEELEVKRRTVKEMTPEMRTEGEMGTVIDEVKGLDQAQARRRADQERIDREANRVNPDGSTKETKREEKRDESRGLKLGEGTHEDKRREAQKKAGNR